MDAFQDIYPKNVSHCYSCGNHNTHGHQIKFAGGVATARGEVVAVQMPESFGQP